MMSPDPKIGTLVDQQSFQMLKKERVTANRAQQWDRYLVP